MFPRSFRGSAGEATDGSYHSSMFLSRTMFDMVVGGTPTNFQIHGLCIVLQHVGKANKARAPDLLIPNMGPKTRITHSPQTEKNNNHLNNHQQQKRTKRRGTESPATPVTQPGTSQPYAYLTARKPTSQAASPRSLAKEQAKQPSQWSQPERQPVKHLHQRATEYGQGRRAG